METQTYMHRMGLNPFLTFYIDTMLNFDGDVDANTNANVKCEHTITRICFVACNLGFFFEIPVVFWHFCVTSNGNKLEIVANQINLNTNLDLSRAHRIKINVTGN